MITEVLIAVLALAAVALVLFVALVVGMRNEPAYDRLNARAPGPLATLTRRLLGASVRKPCRTGRRRRRDAARAMVRRRRLHTQPPRRRGQVTGPWSSRSHLSSSSPSRLGCSTATAA